MAGTHADYGIRASAAAGIVPRGGETLGAGGAAGTRQ